MPATISVNFASQSEVQNSPQPTNKSVSAKVLADVLGSGGVSGGYVSLATAQTITGAKTFSAAVTLNTAPTLAAHATTKGYVDSVTFQQKYTYTIASPTSTITASTPEANSRSLSLPNALNLDVYRNGVLLVNNVDYTVQIAPTNTITFTTQLAAGAVVQVNQGGIGSALANAGVQQITAGTGISISPAGGTGAVTVSVGTFSSSTVMVNQGSYGGINTSSVVDAFYLPNWSDNKSYIQMGQSGLIIRNPSQATRMEIESNGNVTINNMLKFPNNVQDKIYLYDNYGIGVNGGEFVNWTNGGFSVRQAASNGQVYAWIGRNEKGNGGYVEASTNEAESWVRLIGQRSPVGGTVNDRCIAVRVNTTPRFNVLSNGTIEAVNTSIAGLSDERFKQNITPANSQWDDVKNIQICNFKFKHDIAEKGENGAELLLGPIAQQVQQVSPGLVYDNGEALMLKASILYMKAFKALQEAMNRIEILEAKVAALENNNS